MKKPLEALQYSEYTKARVFAETVSRRSDSFSIEGTRSDVTNEDLRKDTELNDQLAALTGNLQEARKRADKQAIKALEPQVKQAKEALAEHVTMLREKYPLFAATRYPEPMGLEQTSLKDNEWVLAYHVTDPGIIIYLTKGKEIVKALFKPVPRDRRWTILSLHSGNHSK